MTNINWLLVHNVFTDRAKRWSVNITLWTNNQLILVILFNKFYFEIIRRHKIVKLN